MISLKVTPQGCNSKDSNIKVFCLFSAAHFHLKKVYLLAYVLLNFFNKLLNFWYGLLHWISAPPSEHSAKHTADSLLIESRCMWGRLSIRCPLLSMRSLKICSECGRKLQKRGEGALLSKGVNASWQSAPWPASATAREIHGILLEPNISPSPTNPSFLGSCLIFNIMFRKEFCAPFPVVPNLCFSLLEHPMHRRKKRKTKEKAPNN